MSVLMYQIGVSGLLSLLITLVTLPLAITFLKHLKLGQMIQLDGPKHAHKESTPTMGGVWIAVVVLSVMYWSMPTSGVTYWVWVWVYGSSVLLGAWDDYAKIASKDNDKGLRPKQKLIAQVGIAVVAVWLFVNAVGSERATMLVFPAPWSTAVNLGGAYYIWVALVITTASNAVNITDGLDGLAASLISLMLCALLLLIMMGAYDKALLSSLDVNEAAVTLAALLGGYLGYWYYNKHPARIFMGDSGSLAAGSVLGFAVCFLHIEWVSILFAAVFLIEMLSVVIQVVYFKTTGLRFFKMAPIHHHFELCGYTENQVVAMFLCISLLCTVCGLALAMWF